MKTAYKVLFLLVIFSLVLNSVYVKAAELNILFDQETQDFIKNLMAPVLQQAKLDKESIKYYIVDDNTINAFTAGGQTIFINTGLLASASSPDAIRGVLAHELSHILAGHASLQNINLKGQGVPTSIGVIGGLGALLFGGPVGLFFIFGLAGLQIDYGRTLEFSRYQESSADLMAAELLDSAKLTSTGLLSFMLILNEKSSIDRRFEWASTHPLTIDRISFLKNWVKKSKYSNNLASTDEVQQLKNIIAKLQSFNVARTLSEPIAPLSEATKNKFEYKYGYANALFFSGNFKAAIVETNKLIATYPNNPYLQELLGDIYYASVDYNNSAKSYAKAIKLNPNAYYYYILLSKAEMGVGTTESYQSALKNIQYAMVKDSSFKNIFMFKQKSIIYGKMNQPFLAKLALADAYFAENEKSTARSFAIAAIQGLTPNSPDWIHAQDIIYQTQQVQ